MHLTTMVSVLIFTVLMVNMCLIESSEAHSSEYLSPAERGTHTTRNRYMERFITQDRKSDTCTKEECKNTGHTRLLEEKLKTTTVNVMAMNTTLVKSMIELNSTVKELNARLESCQKSIENDIKSLTKKFHMTDSSLQRSMDDLKRDGEMLQTALDSTSASVVSLEEELNTIFSDVNSVRKELVKLGNDIKDTVIPDALSDIKKEIKVLQEVAGRTKEEQRIMEERIEEAFNSIQREKGISTQKVEDVKRASFAVAESLSNFKELTENNLQNQKEVQADIESRMTTDAEDTRDKFEVVNGKLEAHESNLTTVHETLTKHDMVLNNKTAKLDERISTANESLLKIEGNISAMINKLEIHEKDLSTAFENLFRKDVIVVIIFVILCVNICLTIAVVVLCQSLPKSGSPGMFSTTSHTRETYYNPVLDQVLPSPQLQNFVGVISFSREYQTYHRKLINSVIGTSNDYVKYHVILTDKDIPEIPLCRLIIICIEFSDRDVIIEERGFGLGDCNRTTLAAAQKIGATPVIFYCKDLRSQRLHPGELFSPSIRCATHQAELIPLSDTGRFFSVYETFTETQKTAISRLIEDVRA